VPDGLYREVGETLVSYVQLCGRLVVRLADERLEHALPGNQGRRALAYLTLERHRPVPRAELVDALWPDDAPTDSEGALAAVLSKLRRVVGVDRLAGRRLLELRLPVDTVVDVEAAHEAIHRAEAAVRRGEYAAAWGPARVALHTASRALLPGDDAYWLEPPRAALNEVLLRAHECVAAAGVGLGGVEVDSALRSGRALVRLAPLRESGARALIEALVARGEHADGLAAYEELRQRLRDRLGASPGPVTEALYRSLLLRT
jgi:DNA-binding SARP family transcriptional activator